MHADVSGSAPARLRLDGATLAGTLFGVLLIMPEGIVVAGIPINVQPFLVVALLLGLLWIAAHSTTQVGMAKGRSAVRTALVLYLVSHLVTFAVATRYGLVSDEARVADSSMIKLLAIVGAGLFLCDGVRGREQLERATRTLAVVLTLVAAIGLMQFALNVDLTQYAKLIPGLEAGGVYDSIQLRNGLRRPAGTSNHPIEFGMVCAMGIPLAVHCGNAARAAGRRGTSWWMFVGVLGAGTFVAVSRTAILCLAVVAVGLILTLPGWQKLYVLLFGGSLLVLAGLFVRGLLGTLFGLFANASDDPSIQGRTEDYPLVWAQVDLHPWVGRGFGTYFPDRYVLLDNQYLGTLVENGWIGLLCLAVLFLSGVYAAVRARMLATDARVRSLGGSLATSIAVGIVGAFTFDLLGFAQVAVLLVSLVGLAGALLREAAARRPENQSRPLGQVSGGRR